MRSKKKIFGMLLVILFSALTMACTTITSLGLNPNTTKIANGRAYYRITETEDALGRPKWIRAFYTDTPTGFNGIVKPVSQAFGEYGGDTGNQGGTRPALSMPGR